MTDAAPYGWSALKADGARLFILGAPIETAMTSIATYAAQADFVTAWASYEASLLPFATVQQNQANALSKACAAAITGGYSSAALGAAHWYGSQLTDQANLDADMMAAASGGASVTANIKCSADAGATWVVVSHTAAQIGQLWADFRAWRIACQAKNDALQAQVAAATTAAAVAGVVWA